MVDIMTLNQLFYLGILIPTLVTVAIFVTFLVCWYRMRIRDRIRYKRHDPHGRFKDCDSLPSVQKQPLQSLTLSNTEQNIQKYNNNNENKNNGNYDESGEIVEERLQENTRPMFHPSHDSGMAHSGDVNNKQEKAAQRPDSQASTDSEDSGFRSSRSGQYNHSASSSNAQDQCQNTIINSKPHDSSLPLFRPVKVNASDARQMLRIPVHRTPYKHKKYLRKPLPSSQAIETIDLNQIHPDLHFHPKNSMQAMSKQPPLIPLHPEMVFTTVMVHRPFTEEMCDPTFSAA